jgi:hypothetical protein
MYVYVVWQNYCMREIGRRGEVAARTAVESAVDCTAEEQEQSNRTDPVVGVSSSFRHAIATVATSIRRHDRGNARRFVVRRRQPTAQDASHICRTSAYRVGTSIPKLQCIHQMLKLTDNSQTGGEDLQNCHLLCEENRSSLYVQIHGSSRLHEIFMEECNL